ncbi:ferredoxin [Streptomyces sp. TLI_185]|uniref:ferredoxin n=1 Tax=Streptomyces sp. TLI_185 TaxID=2485151 RepID=UPI000F4FF371|nr:ferredoxin [Streptomyces sp. TLI_185]RPF24849.1 ferredoxin [Streptomyces sp. TLI_185]
MKLVVDPSRCVGAGMCALIAPEYFDQDEEGRVEPLRTVDAIDESVRRAADSCPSGAVRVIVEPRPASDTDAEHSPRSPR